MCDRKEERIYLSRSKLRESLNNYVSIFMPRLTTQTNAQWTMSSSLGQKKQSEIKVSDGIFLLKLFWNSKLRHVKQTV